MRRRQILALRAAGLLPPVPSFEREPETAPVAHQSAPEPVADPRPAPITQGKRKKRNGNVQRA